MPFGPNMVADGSHHTGPSSRLDLSLRIFQPIQISQYEEMTGPQLSCDELCSPATVPPVQRLAVTCDTLPRWTLDIIPRLAERVDLRF